MRIGIFTDTYSPQINGVVTSIEIFTKELRNLDHEVFIFAPKVTGKEKKEKNIFRFGSMVFPFQPEHRISFPYSMEVPEFSELKIDIVHAQTPFSIGLLGMYLAQKDKLPFIYTHHTLYSEYVHYMPILPPEAVKGFTVWASKVFCDKCNLVIAPSQQIKELLESYEIKSEIVIIPTGIDLDSIRHIKTLNLHRRYNLTPQTKILTFSGRLGKEKNIDFLLEAFHKMIKEYPAAHLFIIGDGPEKKRLQDLSKKLGISRRVTFTGYFKRDDVIAACRGSDVFVFSSATETQGLSVLEALAADIPAVAVDAMGVSDVLEGNRGGFLTKMDLDDFNSKILQLLQDNSIYTRKVKEAKQRTEELSAKSTANLLVKCYNKVLKKRGNL